MYRPTPKPIMDSRPYDIPLAANHAKKRSRDELSQVEAQVSGVHVPLTTTPVTRTVAGAVTPMPQPKLDAFQLMQSTLGVGVVGVAGTHVEEPILQVDVPSSASQSDEDRPRRKISRQAAATDIGVTDQPDDRNASSAEGSKEIEEYARLLGIGWSAPGRNPAAVASMRGLHRFIENNYPLTGVKIVAQNRKDLVHLIQAVEGWYLFTDDLRGGQRLAGTKEQAIRNVKQSPVKFEGVPMVYHEKAAALLNTPSPPGSSTDRTSIETDEGMVVGKMEID